MKLRYFYKIDHKKQPIPGSNIRRKSRPGATHQWKEILDPCCDPLTILCTCGPRFFVQLDGKGKPVDHSLIKRWSLPEMSDGIKYYEIDWMSACCSGELGWDIQNTGFDPGNVTIYINGVIVVNQGNTGNGTVVFPSGATLRVVFEDADGNCSDLLIRENGNIIGGGFETSGEDETINNLNVQNTYTVSANIQSGVCGE